MPVNISIKNVPDDLATQIRRRAARSKRSLQGELLVILEEAAAREAKLPPQEVYDRARKSGLKTPREAVEMLRRDRRAH
ncbi:MAG: FitA-like ribbon-helix-helix domain-containing protein [Thermoanaerobaculia bacterium]